MTALLTFWNWLSGTWLGRGVAIAAGVLLALWYAFAKGKAAERRRAKERDHENAKRIEDRADAARRRAAADDRTPDPGCASLTDASETERTICRELRNALPTWSVEDTEQSKREAADFLSVFSAVCPE